MQLVHKYWECIGVNRVIPNCLRDLASSKKGDNVTCPWRIATTKQRTHFSSYPRGLDFLESNLSRGADSCRGHPPSFILIAITAAVCIRITHKGCYDEE